MEDEWTCQLSESLAADAVGLMIPKCIDLDSSPSTARPQPVEGSSFLFTGLEEVRTVLRKAQDER